MAGRHFSDKDDPLTAICPEVAPAEGERLIIKSEASAFGAGLGDELKAAGVEWLFICGVWTEACVDATVKSALKLGFRVVLVKDACVKRLGCHAPDRHSQPCKQALWRRSRRYSTVPAA